MTNITTGDKTVKLPANHWRYSARITWRNNRDGTWTMLENGYEKSVATSDAVIAKMYDRWLNPQRSDIGNYQSTGPVYGVGHRDGLVHD